jgi:PST family polysaccharide transporter
VGGSQVLNVAVGMIRTKAMAIMLGPAGFGLFGLYTAVSSLAQTIAGMGINSSGVREIAAASSKGEPEQIAKTASVLRYVAIVLGVFGAAIMVIFAEKISWVTFNTNNRAASIRWLSFAVFLMLISGAQTALIQGMRRVADLAKVQVIGASAGVLCAIPLVYVYRERGIVPSLICVAITTILTSWWYSRKLSISIRSASHIRVNGRHLRQEIAALLKLGGAFMVSSCTTLGVAYAIRVCILHNLGIASTGLYQSAWTLGGLYVGIILQAMGADFYPRLTAVAQDNGTCNRLTNEQTLIGLVIAGPGVLCSLTLAPLVIALFYSAKFVAAVSILRWVCLGAFLQVISFPMGYMIIAKAERALFVACEISWGIVSVSLAWYLIPRFGLTGAGLTYFLSYVFHCVMIWALVRRLTGFSWSAENVRVGLITLAMIGIGFGGLTLLPAMYGIGLASVATILSSIYSLRILAAFIEPQRVPAPIRRLLTVCGVMHTVPVCTESSI